MNIITHATIGAACGIATGNPVIAFGAGVVSHVVLDLIPHTDQGTFFKEDSPTARWPLWLWTSAVLDAALAFALLLYLLTLYPSSFYLPIIGGALGGLSIDLIDNVPFWRHAVHKTTWGKKIHAFHEKFHNTVSRQNWWLGFILQIIVLIGGLWYLWKNSLFF